MAQRRMFSLKIVDSDAFLDMPQSTQLLYFHLGMHADDDGFVNPRKIMRVIGSQDDDLKVLVSKRFILPFDNGVVVVKHWLINNLIRKDFYQPTVYLEQKKLLQIKDNKAYTESCSQIVNNLDTQVRIGKVRLGNISSSPKPVMDASKIASKGASYSEAFITFWSVYPRKVGKGAAWRAWKNAKDAEGLIDAIKKSVAEHQTDEQWTREGGRFIPHPATFINQRRWEDELGTAPSAPVLKTYHA